MPRDEHLGDEPPFAVQIPSDFKGLAILREDVSAWIALRGDPDHRVEVVQPATLVVRFRSSQLAQMLRDDFGGRLLGLNERDPEP